MIRMKRLLIVFLFLLFLSGCTSQQNTVTIKTATEEIKLFVEVADNIEEQATGLMYRTELASDQGMLFVFEEEKQRIFWMKNTKIPLDILFIDADGVIVDIKENFQPCVVDDCEKYYSKSAQYALEVNAGFVRKNGIVIGDTLAIE